MVVLFDALINNNVSCFFAKYLYYCNQVVWGTKTWKFSVRLYCYFKKEINSMCRLVSIAATG